MTIAEIKAYAAAAHQKSVAELTVAGTDLFLLALNNVRRAAERAHNFEESRTTATAVIDGAAGCDLSTVVWSGAATVPQRTPSQVEYTYVGGGGSNNDLVASATYKNANGDVTGVMEFTYVDSTNNIATTLWTPGVLPSATWKGIKEIVNVSRQRPDGTYIPLDFTRSDIPVERDRTELEFSDNLFPYLRYPSDAQINARGTTSSIIQRGNWLGIHPRFNTVPAGTYNVLLEVYAWLPDYTAANLDDVDPTDFFVDSGADYLLWATVCELNYVFQTFVPRTEGSLPPPEKARDEAWAKLIAWDSYRIDSNSTRPR